MFSQNETSKRIGNFLIFVCSNHFPRLDKGDLIANVTLFAKKKLVKFKFWIRTSQRRIKSVLVQTKIALFSNVVEDNVVRVNCDRLCLLTGHMYANCQMS